MIITFCGHSTYCPSSEDERKLLQFFEERIGDRPAEFFLGGYGHFDSFARSCAAKYKRTHPNVRLILVTPYITPSYQKTHLEYARELYDEILYPELESVPPRYAITYRNRYMVEKADVVVAYIVCRTSGAYETYRHAVRKKKEIFYIQETKLSER